jgi:membrane protease YdiL (CAAX protease family)
MPLKLDRYLLLETVSVPILAILAVKWIGKVLASRYTWLLAPLILVIAALLPTRIRHRRFAEFGLSSGQMKTALVVASGTCIAVFPAAFFGLWVLRSYGIGLPKPSALPREQGWFGVVFYQFLYVALAEEVFFRGYLQSNILSLAESLRAGRLWLEQWISIVLSAGYFAIAHIIVQGRLTAALTFLPGLVLGWLFIRTKSLLAPILFHGTANISYIIMAGLFE